MLREADIGAVQVRMASSLLAGDTQSAGPGERFVGSGRARRANALGTGVACVAFCDYCLHSKLPKQHDDDA